MKIGGCFRTRSNFLNLGSGERLTQSYAIGPALLTLANHAVATVAFVVIHRRH
jgi:hypothetical protein